MSLTAEQFAALMPDARALLSDEPEMESSLHYEQLALLVSCLQWYWRELRNFFIGANLTVYYHNEQLRQRQFRGPDFFVVREVDPRPRNSWVVWGEDGRYPDLIIELLSDSTARVDRTEKKTLYQNVFRTPEYFWFSPVSLELEGFHLVDGKYQPIEVNEYGWRWSQMLELYLGVDQGQLRYFDRLGQKLPTPAEAAEMEMQRAEAARQRADDAQQRADDMQHQLELERQRSEQMAQRLRELGVDVDRQEGSE
jgi:Uma2 family endonuclease